jgi:AcrR family transcriptional regulator
MPRPRTPEAHILQATTDLLVERGIEGFSVDTVAATAGVSKATIYRWWGSRAQLIHAAISAQQQPFVEPDTGSLREDLSVLLRQLIAYVSRRHSSRLFITLVDAAARDPELETLRKQTIKSARTAYQRVLRRGVERGELGDDVDIELLIDLLMSPVLFRSHIEREKVRAPYGEALIDTVLTAFTHRVLP